jgi:hypothetical protein
MCLVGESGEEVRKNEVVLLSSVIGTRVVTIGNWS